MALSTQKRKRRIELQPTKIRLRLVQIGIALVAGPELPAGTTTLSLTFMPVWLEPGAAIVLGSAVTENAEALTVKEVNPSAATIVVSPTVHTHKPFSGEYVTPEGFGRTVVMGRIMWASRLGLNGATAAGRGFIEGKYERLLKNEGNFEVSFPNSVGTDGILHRERFLCLAKQNYRPGDEWIEIWRAGADSVAGDLLFVGTPVNYQINEQSITISGFDGFATLKKQREGTAGWFVCGPRDAFEEFTKAFMTIVGDGFDSPGNFPESGAQRKSVDQRWEYYNALGSPVTSYLRLSSTVTSALEYARLMATESIAIGLGSATKFNRWRVETTMSLPAIGETDEVALALSTSIANPYIEVAVTGKTALNVTVKIGGTTIETLTVQQTGTTGTGGISAGSHSFAIEGRWRWLYFYIDGVLIFSYPMPEGSHTVHPEVWFYPTAAKRSPSFYVDVDYVLLREMQSYLMRSATDHGDYRLPGAPVAGGLQGVYFNDADLFAAHPTDVGNRQMNPSSRGGLITSQGNTTTAVWAERVDPAIVYAITGWEPSGLPTHEHFSVRWTGSVYLDFGYVPGTESPTKNYRFSVEARGGYRLWVGKTRMTEQIIDTWQLAPDQNQRSSTSGGLIEALTTGGKPPPSGWYPLILEFQSGKIALAFTAAVITLSYIRSDSEHLKVPVNTGHYSHVIAAAEPFDYFPLNTVVPNQPLTTIGNSVGGPDEWFGNETGTGELSTVPSPIPNDVALYMKPVAGEPNFYFEGFTTSMFGTSGFTAWTIEIWVNPDSVSARQIIFMKGLVWQLEIMATGKINCLAGNGTVWENELASNMALTAKKWTHVAVTYTGSNLKIYFNGVEVDALSIEKVGSNAFGTNGLVAGLGYWPQGGAGAKLPYSGAMAHLALYKRALTASELLAHIKEGLSSVLLNGKEVAPGVIEPGAFYAVSAVPTSPQGVFEQLVRNDSHFNQMAQFVENFGYQVTCRPEPLESGNFPGLLCPRVREGHDTDYILDHENTIGANLTVQAEDVADSELVDAQGLADPTNSSQLYAELFNFPEVAFGNHLFVSTEYDSPGDIQTIPQLVQRASSLLALRSTPWTVVSGTGPGKRELTDTFPISGQWTEFAWLPGDGFRYELPLLGLEDETTRQIYDAQWSFFPDGILAPTIAVLQRPKSLLDTLRRIHRESLDESRNYQGQLVTVMGANGSKAVSAGAEINTGSAVDGYSRISLPMNLTTVVRLVLVIQTLWTTGGTTWTIEVNGTSTGIPVTVTGRYDLTRFFARAGSNQQRTFVRLTSNLAGSGSYEIALEALVRV